MQREDNLDKRKLKGLGTKGGENNMKKALRIGSRTIPVWLLIAIIVAAAVASASVIIATIQIGYKITPSGGSAATMTPSTLNLDLGTIPSGSSGTKDFGKVATLNLPVGYEINFTLDRASAVNFPTFDANIVIYKSGDTTASYWTYLYNNDLFFYSYTILPAGSYDIHISVDYTAVPVTTETTGTVKIGVSYPG
jgi:hypothetical protein